MNKKRRSLIGSFLPFLLTLGLLLSMLFLTYPSQDTRIGYDKWNEILENNEITEAKISIGDTITEVSGKYTQNGKTQFFSISLPKTDTTTEEVFHALKDRDVKLTVVEAEATNSWVMIIANLLPYLLLIVGGYFLYTKVLNIGMSGQKSMDFGKSKARLLSDVKVKFSDVAGADEEKEEMEELVSYLKNPKKFSKMGARIPKGVILVGPPGTGKTLLAKAVAGEANVPFFSISGSDFVEMFVGVGATRVRDMFKEAKAVAPSIIFIDEIDAVGRERGAGLGGGHDEREQTLNQLLVEMDGVNDNSGVLIIAATNRSDVLDPALLRAGRFDRQITVNLPDRKGRYEILKVHARNKKLDTSVNLDAIAKRTPGFSGADLENVLNEAAILAVREDRELIYMEDLDEAIDRVMMGPAKRSRTYTEKEKKMVAYHESGHAIIGLFLENASIVRKITIIPRGMAGGYNLMTPKEETYTSTKSELLARITSYLGGRAAEELFLDDISTGAYEDIKQATGIARAMVLELGMSELGPIQFQSRSGSVFLGRDYSTQQNYSDEIAYAIDKEVKNIIESCHEKARELIMEHKTELENLVAALLENETITAEQIDNVIAGRDINHNINTVEDAKKED